MNANKYDGQQVPQQTQEEVNLKLKFIDIAIDRGELDHKHPDQSFTGRYERALYRIAANALKEDVCTDQKAMKLKSIIGMVHTLVLEGRADDLYWALNKAFPEYY